MGSPIQTQGAADLRRMFVVIFLICTIVFPTPGDLRPPESMAGNMNVNMNDVKMNIKSNGYGGYDKYGHHGPKGYAPFRPLGNPLENLINPSLEEEDYPNDKLTGRKNY